MPKHKSADHGRVILTPLDFIREERRRNPKSLPLSTALYRRGGTAILSRRKKDAPILSRPPNDKKERDRQLKLMSFFKKAPRKLPNPTNSKCWHFHNECDEDVNTGCPYSCGPQPDVPCQVGRDNAQERVDLRFCLCTKFYPYDHKYCQEHGLEWDIEGRGERPTQLLRERMQNVCGLACMGCTLRIIDELVHNRRNRHYEQWCDCIASLRRTIKRANYDWCLNCTHKQFEDILETAQDKMMNIAIEDEEGDLSGSKCVVCREIQTPEEMRAVVDHRDAGGLRWCLACCRVMKFKTAHEVDRGNETNNASSDMGRTSDPRLGNYWARAS